MIKDGRQPVLIRCPRCGYDQRGVVEAWSDSCPLDGVCSECGLEFAWAHVFNPGLHPPRWCVEYARWWGVPWRAITTLLMSLLPMRFWRTLRMHHQFKWRRMLLYLLVLLMLPYVAFAHEVGKTAFDHWRSYEEQRIAQDKSFVAVSPAVIKSLAAKGLTPQNFISRRRIGPVQAIAQAVSRPWSVAPLGYTIYQDGTRRKFHTSPRDIVLDRFGRSDAWLLWSGRSMLYTIIYSLWFTVLMPALFVLLPVTRRVSRVRWTHLLRISLYSLLWPMLGLAWIIHRAPMYYSQLGLGGAGGQWEEVALLSIVLVPLAVILWWGIAASRHLQLRSPWLIALLLATINHLLLMLCGYFWLIVNQRPDWLLSGS